MKLQWSDWTLSWADNGIFDIADYLDLPRSQFIYKSKHDENNATYSINLENPDWDNMLLSVYRDNRIQYSQIYGNTEMLERGTQLLDNLLAMPLHDAYSWHGLEFPELGLHLDLDNKKFCYWHSETDMDNIHKKIQANAQNWQCLNWKSDYHKHLALLDEEKITLPMQSLEKRQTAIIERLRNGLMREAKNPAIDVANLMSEKGKDVTVSGATEIYRGSVGTAKWKSSILEKLEQLLPVDNMPISDKADNYI